MREVSAQAAGILITWRSPVRSGDTEGLFQEALCAPARLFRFLSYIRALTMDPDDLEGGSFVQMSGQEVTTSFTFTSPLATPQQLEHMSWDPTPSASTTVIQSPTETPVQSRIGTPVHGVMVSL